MTSSAPEHTADEAGGEAIFSSDGLPSLVGLLPPPLPTVASRISGTGRDENDDAVIEDDSGVDPRVAFETFADRRNDDAGWSVLSSSGGGRSSGDETFSSADDPRRRLFRLRAEIVQLEAQLAEEGSATSAAARGGEEDALHSMALELKSRLDAMGIGGDFASLSTMIRGRQEDLSRVILRDLEKIAAGAKGDTTDSKKEENQSGKIIYELFKESASMNSSSSREAMLEQRLRKLETAMGVKGAEGEKSLLIRLEEAERLSKEVDAKEIEKIAAKAKVIRSDLEAAARAKAKLSSNSSNPSSVSAHDSQTITSLHNQLVELEGISSHLPALTVRLTELSNLHSNAAEFGVRLDAAEAAASRSEVLLRNVEEALGKMEVGWKDNMEAVEKNVKKLDDFVAAQSSP